ncbi:MAG: PEP-CTERM sorting domain-containing protein [Planctomycetota bacterium]
MCWLRSIPQAVWLSCLTVLFVASRAQGGFITNGDFETAVPPNGTGGGWTSSGVNFGGWFATGGNPAGHMLLNLNGVANQDPTVQQTVSGLTIGQQYTLSFDYALHVNSSGANGNSFGVFLDTQADPLALDASNAIFIGENLSTSYVTESVSFVATNSTHELFFAGELDDRTNGGLGTSDVSYRLDNVSLVTSVSAVPEPGGMLVFVAGCLSVSLRRRRETANARVRKGRRVIA